MDISVVPVFIKNCVSPPGGIAILAVSLIVAKRSLRRGSKALLAMMKVNDAVMLGVEFGCNVLL